MKIYKFSTDCIVYIFTMFNKVIIVSPMNFNQLYLYKAYCKVMPWRCIKFVFLTLLPLDVNNAIAYFIFCSTV